EGQVGALATAGAFGSLGLERRAALWAAGAVAQARADRLPGAVVGAEAPRLPGVSPVELGAADLWGAGLCAGGPGWGATPPRPPPPAGPSTSWARSPPTGWAWSRPGPGCWSAGW